MSLADLLAPNTGFSNWADTNSGNLAGLGSILSGIGGGLAMGGNDPRAMLQGVNQGLQNANPQAAFQQAATNAQIQKTQQAQNQTIQALKNSGPSNADLVTQALSGDMAGAWQTYVARQQQNAAGALMGSKGASPQQVNMATTGAIPPATAWQSTLPQPINYNSLGTTNQLTNQATPYTFPSNNSGGPPGTTGKSLSESAQMPGYTSNVVGGTGGRTQAAVDQAALAAVTTGNLPTPGRNGVSTQFATAVANRAAELSPSGNLGTNKVVLKSLSESLANQQKQLDSTTKSLSNAENGFQQVINAFNGKVNVSQYPTVNQAFNAAQAQLDPATIAAYKAGLQEVANEYSQVFARGSANGVTDTVRKSAADIINGNLSPMQLQQILNELQQQGNIVLQGGKNQVAQITSQIDGIVGGQPATSAPSGASSQFPNAPPVGTQQGGYTYTGGDPANPSSWKSNG